MFGTFTTRIILIILAGALACGFANAQAPDTPARPAGPSTPNQKPELFGDPPAQPVAGSSNSNHPGLQSDSAVNYDLPAPSSPEQPNPPSFPDESPAEQESSSAESQTPIKRSETYRHFQPDNNQANEQEADAANDSLGRNQNEGKPFSQDGESAAGISLWEAIPLGIVLALIFALAWVVKRFLRGRNFLSGTGTVRIVDRTAVSPKQSLLLIKVGQRLILVGVSPEGMSALSEIDDPEQVAMLMGRAASHKSNSISRAFSEEVADEREEYARQPMADDPVEQTGGQIRGLLDKVRRFTNYHDVA